MENSESTNNVFMFNYNEIHRNLFEFSSAVTFILNSSNLTIGEKPGFQSLNNGTNKISYRE